MSRSTARVRAVPLLIGSALLIASVVLVSEDVLNGHPLTATTAIQPLLVLGATAAAVLAHHRAIQLHLLAACVFGVLAVAGSGLVVFNALARTAGMQDAQHAAGMRSARALDSKLAELRTAKDGAAKECRVLGERCKAWQARVDALQAASDGMEVRAVDPRADTIAAMATLVGLDGTWVRALVLAFAPASLPVWIELAAAAFLAAAFPASRNRQQFQTVPAASEGTVSIPSHAWSQAAALRDFQAMRQSGAQQFLAQKWGRAESTISRWLAEWERDGLIRRNRVGKEKATLALPPPR